MNLCGRLAVTATSSCRLVQSSEQRDSLLVVDTLIVVLAVLALAVLVGDRNKSNLPTEEALQVDGDLQSM